MDNRTRARAFISITLLCLAAALSQVFAAAADIGEKIGEFRLQDTAGNTHSLDSYAGKVIVLAFWSFKCPVALACNDRLTALQSKYGNRGVVVLGVASNANESKAEIQRNVSNLNLSFPILLDSDGMVAERLGASHTPGIFILDPGAILRYKGSLDNNKKLGDRGREANAEEAIDSILAGQPVAKPETAFFGCSIKRKSS
jgi:peroxiredoxin